MASDDQDVRVPKPPRVWPGMPTRRSKTVELLFVFFPVWLAVIGMMVALLLPVVQSCRNALRERMADDHRFVEIRIDAQQE